MIQCKKKLIPLLLCAAMLFSLVSCGGAKTYRSDVPVDSLAAAGEACIALRSNLSDATEEFLDFYLEIDTALCNGFKVRRPSGSSAIDEYGIFSAKSAEDAETIRGALNKYLKGRVDAWDTRYDQSEKPKVDGAKTTVYGNYVIYTILSSSEQTAFLSAVEELLIP
ncbi:MAG: DUF4358 domain-containing protein [Eubacteriales bacterium]|nr:DUF4358 domain-containing protein [Eubacteriales bacterium]